MPDVLASILLAAAGAVIGALVQHAFRRHAESAQVRREVVESHLLQLQDATESLYYRANNLRRWSGKGVMSDEYYERTSAYVVGRVLAHAALLVARGVYAKLPGDRRLKRDVKARLHAIDRALDDMVFLHWHRAQLGEMLTDEGRVVTYTEFVDRLDDARWSAAYAAAARFVASVSIERLDRIAENAGALVALLAAQTGVPSALELSREAE